MPSPPTRDETSIQWLCFLITGHRFVHFTEPERNKLLTKEGKDLAFCRYCLKTCYIADK